MERYRELEQLRNIKYMLERIDIESKECDELYEHKDYAIKITREYRGWMTVYARCRKTHKKVFEASVKKGYGRGVVYYFRNARSLDLLGLNYKLMANSARR